MMREFTPTQAPLLTGQVAESPDPLHVLLIEDRADAVLAVSRPLMHSFAPVELLATGDLETFRVALEYGAWDLVVSDPDNRRCAPERILEILEEDGLDTPYLLVAADMDSPGAAAALSAGAHACVELGIPAELTKTVQRLVPVRGRGEHRRVSDAAYSRDPLAVARRLRTISHEAARCAGSLAAAVGQQRPHDPLAARALARECLDAAHVLAGCAARLRAKRPGA